MSYKEILEQLGEIEGLIEEASNNLPDYSANTDTRISLDIAVELMYGLRDELEKTILDGDRVISGEELEEVLHHPPVSLL
mgnify:FL=1|jgi:hypothetical protein|tara:strand:+ start:664 stop:903 length:240 start_codon:yes stop_codon:yes gene_type:complete